MTLIKSISGIRGIIGTGLTPLEICKFTAAYSTLVKNKSGKQKIKIIIGRDARVSGRMMSSLVSGTLMGCGADVIDLGLASTPTVEMAVPGAKADGGIIITASHNPGQWNALKLLNSTGEFISSDEGKAILAISGNEKFSFAGTEQLGTYEQDETWLNYHVRKILELPLVNTDAIRKVGFRVAFDAVNSVGGIALPVLLKSLGVSDIVPVNASPDGLFSHNPEPLPEHLGQISEIVVKTGAHVGFVVDPDVDRLAVIQEDGGFFGEEYTLVAVADYILSHNPGNTVSNLSSTRALKDVTIQRGGKYFASAVGEVNVVELMKKHKAVIGGEGNGGVIYPDLHHGRDALAGIALFLSHLATSGISCSSLRNRYPDYYIFKSKLELKPGIDLDEIFSTLTSIYHQLPINKLDGLKIEFENGWVHMRASNTEPIVRIYAEGGTRLEAENYARIIINDISSFVC